MGGAGVTSHHRERVRSGSSPRAGGRAVRETARLAVGVVTVGGGGSDIAKRVEMTRLSCPSMPRRCEQGRPGYALSALVVPVGGG